MATKKDVLLAYCEKGFHLFPVISETKRPAIKDNLNLASTDINQIMAWEKKFPGCNWAVACSKSGLVAVDVDHKHGGMEAWDTLITKHGEPETLKAISGSGGLHYVFNANKSKKYRGQIQKGIDVKYNGYIVVYPSKHESSGKLYRWTNFSTHAAREKSYPEWLRELIEKDIRTGKADPTYKFGNKYLEKLVNQLKEKELDYEEWVQAGMSLHAATGGSLEGLQLYLNLTEGESYQDGDTEKAEAKWDSFGSNDNGITQLTLGYLIRKKGGVVPSPQYDEDIKAFKEAKIETFKAEATVSGFVRKDQQLICWSKPEVIKWFNDNGFSFLTTGGKTPFMKVKGTELTTMGEKALYDLTAPLQYATWKDAGADIKMVLSPAYKVWASSIDRKEYDRIVFRPNAGPRELNLWTGIQMTPIKGDPSVIIDFIEKSLCASDSQKSGWLLDWLAHIVQKPHEKATIVPVLIGKQGAGKGLLMDNIMAPILGELYTAVNTSAELMAKFNVKLTKKFLTFIDEATWRGNKTEDGILKRLIGSPTMTVEEKYGATYGMENYSRYLIASNNKEAVALEVGNRRYVVIESSDKYANDLSYFGPIGEKLKNKDLLRSFLGFLMDRDISAFNPFRIIDGNTAGELSKINTAGPIAMFWDDVFSQNPRKLWDEQRGLHCTDTFFAFQDFCNSVKTYEKSISARAFWAKTKDLVANIPAATRKRAGGEARYYFRGMSAEEMAKVFYATLSIEMPEMRAADEFFMLPFEEGGGESAKGHESGELYDFL